MDTLRTQRDEALELAAARLHVNHIPTMRMALQLLVFSLN